MRNLQLVIPAAGLGSRFRSVGIDTPKPLIEINGIPMINWVIGNFQLNPQDKIIIIGREEDNLEALAENWYSSNELNIQFVSVPGLTEGPAMTVREVLPHLDEDIPLIIANSDQFVSKGLPAFIERVREQKDDGLILTMNATGKKWSYIERNIDGSVSRVAEKEEISSEATVGIYSWSSVLLFAKSISMMEKLKDKVNGEYYVAPTYNYLIAEGHKIFAMNVGVVGYSVHGIGTPEDLALFQGRETLPDDSSKIRFYTE
jgi:NDP-sugar pyrophosphorylase family protein